MEESAYGFGENPPYSLYQAEDGKWGLIDGSGKKLKAIFERHGENRFSSVFYEIVAFDEKEGFELVSWYDPSEVWFNFTFDDPAYPKEFGCYMWKPMKTTIHDYREVLYRLMPEVRHWLLDEIFRCDELVKMDDDEEGQAIEAMLNRHPELEKPSITNPLLDPIMRNEAVEEKVKQAVWDAKVSLDSKIRYCLEEFRRGRNRDSIGRFDAVLLK